MGKYKGSGINLHKAYKKYGIENFETEVLYKRIRDKATIDAMEIWAIEKYKPEYNIAKGGQGGAWNKGKKMPAGFGDKVSKFHKGRKHGHWKLSNETRAKMSQPRSIEHRLHISEAMKGSFRALGYKWSTEQKKKLKKSRGNSWKLVDGKRVWYYKEEK